MIVQVSSSLPRESMIPKSFPSRYLQRFAMNSLHTLATQVIEVCWDRSSKIAKKYTKYPVPPVTGHTHLQILSALQERDQSFRVVHFLHRRTHSHPSVLYSCVHVHIHVNTAILLRTFHCEVHATFRQLQATAHAILLAP